MKVGIIGGGWYGAHTARIFAKAGDDVTILEVNPTIFSGLSGMFGVRDHAGPHYPRSKKTRESCHRGSEEFEKHYRNLIIQHKYSIYGLGIKDVNDEPPKVTAAEFKAVCEESRSCREVDITQWGYDSDNVQIAFELHEPSIAVGKRLRAAMERYLKEDKVNILCNYPVKKVKKQGDKVIINDELEFDTVINATSFQTLLPEKPLPFNIDIKYQVCLALVYEDLRVGNGFEPPFSIIFMDGWFPCLMPYDDRTKAEQHQNRQYIMTHGKWTIMGSFDTVDDAKALVKRIDNNFIEEKIKPRCETDMHRFWPIFSKMFLYKHWVVNVVAKVKNEREFRSAITFADDTMTYFTPGKVTNVDDAAREAFALSRKQNVLTDDSGIYHYVQGGVLDDALQEIIEKPISDRNTCDLQTYNELMAPSVSSKAIPQAKVFPLHTIRETTQKARSRNASSNMAAPLPNSFSAPPPIYNLKRSASAFF